MLPAQYLPNPQPDEEIIIFLRRNIFILIKHILTYLVIFLVPLAVYLLANLYLPQLIEKDVISDLLTLLMFLYFLFTWLFFYRGFLDYFLDVWIVTNYRILSIEQSDLFHRTVAEQKLFRIQDVTSQQKGLLPTFINYGDVYIQTAAEQMRFVFEEVSNPHKIAREITQLVDWQKKEHEKEQRRYNKNMELTD